MPKGVYKHKAGVEANAFKHGKPHCEVCDKELKNFYAKRCREHRVKSSYVRGDRVGNWVGDKVSYRALHSWVERQLGKPYRCDYCGTINAKKYDWANISYEYRRELSDWVRLCRSCHIRYDVQFGIRREMVL